MRRPPRPTRTDTRALHEAFPICPRRTATCGLVVIEARSCGTPVAAYTVPGAGDIGTGEAGALDDDLGAAIARALVRDRADAAGLGARYSWSACTAQFLEALTFVRGATPSPEGEGEGVPPSERLAPLQLHIAA